MGLNSGVNELAGIKIRPVFSNSPGRMGQLNIKGKVP